MACISKLTAGFAYNCDSGATGILDAIYMEKADISSFALVPGTNTVGTLAVTGAVRFLDTPKRTLVLNTALKVNDGAPNAFSHSGTLTITAVEAIGSTTPSVLLSAIIDPLANTPVVIIARTIRPGAPGYIYRIYGLYYGMSATAIDQSTHDNGSWFTVTLSTPENVIGEDNLILTSSEYDRLKALAV